MKDQLDSRALGYTDCYGQRFMRPGLYRYDVGPTGAAGIDERRRFTIEVVERSSENRMNQHLVTLTAKGASFTADPEFLRVEVGDLVLWNLRGGRAVPFAVFGDKAFFDSTRLRNESGYSHAFGFAGEYAWRDAHGSPVHGVVRVRDPACKGEGDQQRWRQQLRKGTVVMIHGTKVEPAEVEVVTGQTVFFMVVESPGISITDERLLDSPSPTPCDD